MIAYEVNQVIPSFKGHKQETHFDIDDSGAILMCFFNEPTENEIKQFKSNANFEIRFTVIHDITMFTVKIGNLNWMDAPYAPHLSNCDFNKLNHIKKDEGLAMLVLLIDTSDGRIKHIRLVGLSNAFTQNLINTIDLQLHKDFDRNKYLAKLAELYSTHTTEDIVKLCKYNYKK